MQIDFLNSNIRCRDFIDIWNIHWEGNQSAKHPEFIDLKNPVVKVRKKKSADEAKTYFKWRIILTRPPPITIKTKYVYKFSHKPSVLLQNSRHNDV